MLKFMRIALFVLRSLFLTWLFFVFCVFVDLNNFLSYIYEPITWHWAEHKIYLFIFGQMEI